jgi:YbbR domain-containing protein
MINRINSIFRRNLPAKILALCVAVILWVVVMNDQNPAIEGSFNVPLAVVNSPEGYKITKSEDSVKIKVRGPRSLFVTATADDFRAYVDLDGAQDGKQDCKVQTALPQGFELVEVAPETVSFDLDKIIQKQMRAEVIVTGASAPGTTVAKVTQTSSLVTIEGPESAVDTVVRVVGYVGLSGNSADFDLQVPLTAINADGREVQGVKVVPSATEVSVSLARGLTKKIVTIHPVLQENLPKDYELGDVRTDPIKIEIAGDSKTIESLSAIDTEPIDLSKLTATKKMTVRLALPDGITVTNREVNVSIEVKKKSSN